MSKVAVIQFPGSNCEYETVAAAKKAGLQAEIRLWNEKFEDLIHYDGYILPGGFSFQDRVRAGVIAAKLPVMAVLEAAVDAGKPVLGICNGCQILVESGLVPDLSGDKSVNVAMAKNAKKDEAYGFICDWKWVKITNPKKSLFTQFFTENDVLPIPVNHGEGKFVFDQNFVNQIESLTKIQYCTEEGDVTESHPVNPNGSFNNIAGITNKSGNVLAVMPHPERAYLLRQLPFWIGGDWENKKRESFKNKINLDGPWNKLFQGMKHYIENK